MRQIDEVSSLIGDIYDAAMDPSLWMGTLGRISDFVGGQASGLYAKDASTRTGGIYYDDGRIDQRYVRLYFEKYIKLDPSTTGIALDH
jgi:hypothetical protein